MKLCKYLVQSLFCLIQCLCLTKEGLTIWEEERFNFMKKTTQFLDLFSFTSLYLLWTREKFGTFLCLSAVHLGDWRILNHILKVLSNNGKLILKVTIRTETRKSVNMRSSRRQSNKFQHMASEFIKCALDMNKVFGLRYLLLVL